MAILLATPLFSFYGDAGHFWLKALNQLGHAVVVWDYRLCEYYPAGHYDLTLVLKGEGVEPTSLRRPAFCYWPDAFFRDPGIEKKLRQYDKVFTPVRPAPDWTEWLPTGFDPDIHRDLGLPHTAVNTIYVGTNNSDYKREMIRAIAPTAVYGNGWGELGNNAHNPVYLHDFVNVANRAKILLDVHHDPQYGLNRKLFECCAMGFTLTDQVPGVVDLFGPELADQVSFTTLRQAKELIVYYLFHPEKREQLWSRQQKAIQPYSYLEAAKKILTYLK